MGFRPHHVSVCPAIAGASFISHSRGDASRHYSYGVGVVRYLAARIYGSVARINLYLAVVLENVVSGLQRTFCGIGGSGQGNIHCTFEPLVCLQGCQSGKRSIILHHHPVGRVAATHVVVRNRFGDGAEYAVGYLICLYVAYHYVGGTGVGTRSGCLRMIVKGASGRRYIHRLGQISFQH